MPYAKPEIWYWSAAELDGIIATMSGGSGTTPAYDSNYLFSAFPKDQTSYASLGTSEKLVDDIIVEHEEILAVVNSKYLNSTVFVLKTIPVTKVVGKVTSTGLKLIKLASMVTIASLSDFESGTYHHVSKEWKWIQTDVMPYKMSFRHSYWFSYQGERITEVTTLTNTISFEYGDYTIS